MSISEGEIRNIAKLSRLKINDDNIEEICKDLEAIQKVISMVSEADCEGIEPLCSVHDGHQIFRKDEVVHNITADEIISNAPGSTSDLAKETGFFIVPKVVE